MAKEKLQCGSISNALPSQHVQPNSETFDQSTQEALEHLFSKEQQTYEEFLKSFIYLKKEYTALTSPTTSTASGAANDNNTSLIMSSSAPSVNCGTISQTRITMDDNDELLQQENIGPGNVTTNILLRTKDSCHGKIQLDNYVDDESLENGNSDNYNPSICEERTHKDFEKETTPDSQKNIHTRVSADISVNVRCLNIRTKQSKSSGETEKIVKEPECLHGLHGSYQETENCEVEPFQLDENFDYDKAVQIDFLGQVDE